MDAYTTENEQVEAIKTWLKENGKSALFGVVLGLAAIFGWRSWQQHIISQSEAAAGIYQQALVAVSQDKPQEGKNKAMEIINNYADTGYAVFAHLILASTAAEANDYNAAEQHLSNALEQTGNESLKHEISLRLVRAHIANNKLDQALGLVNTSQPGAYAASYNELKGDILALQGKYAEARLAYQQAITESQSSAVDLSMLNIKLDSLGN